MNYRSGTWYKKEKFVCYVDNNIFNGEASKEKLIICEEMTDDELTYNMRCYNNKEKYKRKIGKKNFSLFKNFINNF